MASLRVFLDADVIFCGAAAPGQHSASQLILTLGEITLLDAVTSTQAIVEAERNLAAKLPSALPAFRLLVQRALRVFPDPTAAELAPFHGIADPKDLPILVAALQHGCPYLVTFNQRHFQPGHPAVAVLRPGEFVLRLRDRLARLDLD